MGMVWPTDFAGPAVQAEGPDGFRSESHQGNDFCLPRLLGDFQQGEGHRQLKSTRPRTPRIQVEDSSVVVLAGLMGVAADDGAKAGGLRLEVEIVEIVEHEEMAAGGFHYRGERKFLRPGLRIHIAAHGKHRGDEFELRKNFGSAHVSRVKDELDTLESALRLRAEQAVSIGNDADPHGARESG
jgi:hypothetical protein